jgi:dienelactone hydrolase
MIKLSRLMKAVALTVMLTTIPAGVALAGPAPASAPGEVSAGIQVHLPRPTGPHRVGRSTLHLIDHARQDPWVPESGARELMVSLYYPAYRGSGARAPYADTEEARLLLRAQGLEDAVPAETLSATRTNSRVGARSARAAHPLVVLSPGFGAPRYTLTTLAEELASRGYVVAAVDHAYESAGTRFPGGRMLTCVACDKAQTEADLRRVNTGRGRDVSFVVDRLIARYGRLIDRNRIGMAGHSIGGASAISAMANDARVRAGVNMDGAFHDPVPLTGLGARPFMMLGTDDDIHRPGGRDRTWDGTWKRLDGWKRWLTVTGSDHLTFTDSPTLGEQLGLPTPPLPDPPLPARRAIEITRTYVTAFFDLHLRRIPQPLLDNPTAANPEVRFNNP